MKKYILIHGGSHGKWCWERCIAELEARGHQAFALDLPGHGLDSTPRNEVDLNSYVDAVLDFLKQHQNDQFTLVGHSLAGITLPEVAIRAQAQVEELIFIAAIVLQAGERAIDFIPENRRPVYFELAKTSDDNSFMATPEMARNIFFHDLSEDEANHYYSLLTPQPLGVYLDAARVALSELPQPKSFILCKEDRAFSRDAYIKFSERLGGQHREIDSGHDVMLSNPKKLVEILVE